MTAEEYNALIEKMKTYAGCAACDSYNGVKCRACTWDDAMDCVLTTFMTINNINASKKDVVIHQIEDMLSRMNKERVEEFGAYFENGHDFIELMENILELLKGLKDENQT